MTARLAIADPPYLRRAARWYGPGGRGSGGGRHRADSHPDAHTWDAPAAHLGLVAQLGTFDGWALACPPDALPLYLPACPGARVAVWHRRNAPPSGARVRATWEAVLFVTPPGRVAYRTGLAVSDVLDVAAPRVGFAGAKPPEWTRWCLALLGHAPGDTVTDLFPGSGSVSGELAQGVLT